MRQILSFSVEDHNSLDLVFKIYPDETTCHIARLMRLPCSEVRMTLISPLRHVPEDGHRFTLDDLCLQKSFLVNSVSIGQIYFFLAPLFKLQIARKVSLAYFEVHVHE
jgi:hypothetical protein